MEKLRPSEWCHWEKRAEWKSWNKDKKEQVQSWCKYFKQLLGKQWIIGKFQEEITGLIDSKEVITDKFEIDKYQKVESNIKHGKVSGPSNNIPS